MMENKDMEELKEGWRRVKLQDICNILSSKRVFKKEYSSSGIKFYRSGDIIELSYGNEIKDWIYITEERFNELKSKYGSPQQGDLLISAVGNRAGIPYVVKEKDGDFYFKDGNIVWFKEFKADFLDSKYLYYWIKSPFGTFIINSLMIGSAQKALTINSLNNIQIELPPLKTQEKIVSILSALDDKIEINNEMNKTLEEMAQTLFKRWFIDFDFPNENGEPYRSSGGKMVDSELGEIPEGWEVATLETKKEFGELIMGLSPKSESYNDLQQGLPLLNGAADFTKLKLSPKKYTTSPTRIAKKGDYVFCIRATIGLLSMTDKDYVIGRGVATIKDIKVEYREYIYMVLNNSFNKLKQNATGSVIQGLSKPDINNMKILFPIYSTMQRFNENMSKIFEKIENNKKEIQSLIEIRDTLLPKLMSGEVEV